MRNLQLYSEVRLNGKELKDVTFFCVDTVHTNLFVYGNGCIYKLLHDSDHPTLEFDLKQYYNTPECPNIVGISYSAAVNAIYVCVEQGDILTVDCNTKDIQFVGCVENGLKVVEWSPDQDAVVLITQLDTIIVMTGSFDPIIEVEFHQDNFGEKQFMTVGWGKKETQFHGSVGKVAAHAVASAVQGTVDSDDGKCSVSWKGDGSLFAVNMVEPITNCRRIYIFSREGILQYTSELTGGLEMPLAWCPSGNLIASTHVLPNKYEVIFFEKNGLRHGEFVLPFAPGDGMVRHLAWNIESSVLAVWYQGAGLIGSYLQLWTVNNNHWYLKQSIPFPLEGQLQAMQWDTEAGLRLHVISSDLSYYCFEWIWTTNYSSVHSSSNQAYVAVIDGSCILLSSFLTAVIPPPMCEKSLQLPCPVSQAVFGPTSDCNSLYVVLNDGRLAMFNGKEKHTLLGVHHVQWACKQPESIVGAKLHHWLWLSDDRLLCVCTFGRASHLVVVDRDDTGCLTARKIIDVGDVVLSLVHTPDASGAVIQVKKRSLLLYSTEQESIKKYQDSLTESYLHMNICHVDDSDVCIGLSGRNRLYVHCHEVANNVTSFALHPKFLLFTTLHHTLHCLRLIMADLVEHKGGRQIEQGARLIITTGTRVVLQMPRGNLECITPRPLVLYEAASLLDSGRYRLAFELFRKHRINLNLLVDHNPKQFLSELMKFVVVVQNPSWLALFLTELSEEDVTQTVYSQSYDRTRQKFLFQPSKVSVVCDRLRDVMHARPDADHYLLPILTSYVQKQSNEDLVAALLKVKAAGSGEISRDEALKYLLFMVDVKELYNVALGLYDFDLMLMVAAKSNMDPKEYAPFLNDLRRMELNYQHFRIDKYLKRYSTALNHIALCPERFDECLEFVKSHDLYLQALQLFPKMTDRYQQVAAAYGDYLMTKKLYEEAAIMYQHSNQLSDALEACRLAVDWREALLLMAQLHYSDSKVQELCRELARSLVEQFRHQEAALLLSQHVGDIEECVAVLVDGYHWNEALRMAHHGNRLDLVETHIKPGVVEHMEELQHQLNNSQEHFLNHKARLAIVRATQHLSLEDNELQVESDLYSDTSSIISSSRSRTSRHSSHSSKNRRKTERKMLSLKEGSPFEDLALIRALHQIVTSCLNLRGEVHNLCRALLKFGCDADAVNLQCLLVNILEVMEQSQSEIWLPEMANLQNTTCFGPNATSNSIAAELQINKCPENRLLLLEPHLRIPPVTSTQLNWKLEILRHC